MPGEANFEHGMRAECSVRREAGGRRDGDVAIAELADRQHGVVARRQLLELGFGRGAILWRLETGRLHPLHRGVYAVGRRAVMREGWWMAAVLACGPGAVLSHRCAAALWGMREGAPDRVEVLVARRLRPHDAIRPGQARLAPDERTFRAGIPVTTVPRTLLDLAAVLQPHELERALAQAELRGLSDPTPLVALLERHRGRRGAAALRRSLANGPLRPTVTKSELERRFLAFAERAGLPRPLTNVWLDADLQVDCLWPDQRLIVELDSRAYHRTTAAFERDRKRDRRLVAGQWRVVRVTDHAMRAEARALRADLRSLLSAPAARARSA
jgi:hypothetical protein